MTERGTHLISDWMDEQPEQHLYAEAPHVVFDLPQHEDPDFDPRIESLGVKLATAELNRQSIKLKHDEVGDYTVIIEDGTHRRDYLEINDNFIRGQERVIFSIYDEMANPLVKTNNPGTEDEMGYERIPDEAGMRMAKAILQELQPHGKV